MEVSKYTSTLKSTPPSPHQKETPLNRKISSCISFASSEQKPLDQILSGLAPLEASQENDLKRFSGNTKDFVLRTLCTADYSTCLSRNLYFYIHFCLMCASQVPLLRVQKLPKNRFYASLLLTKASDMLLLER